MAHAAGVIDDATLAEMERRQQRCVRRVREAPASAGKFCENVTVYWLFSAAGAGEASAADSNNIGLRRRH